MELRDYQIEAVTQIKSAWESGAQNVLIQLSTGAGKTVVFSHIIANEPKPSIAIAHRVELVSQISLALARNGIRHNIIGQKHTIKEIVGIHMDEVGRSYYDPNAKRFVAGVDTLIRLPSNTTWFKDIALLVIDEAAHCLRSNKWGNAASLFPNARGLFPTATPVRSDGKGLGRHADGIIDEMIIGIDMRALTRRGYLSEYRIFAPPSDLDLSSVTLSAGGDYSPPKLRSAVKRSHITGDVVKHYLRIAPGKLGVTFAVSVEAATEIAAAFTAAGIPAEVISAKTPDRVRASIMRRFRKREILQLVNVDILGEGVDVPAIEVVSFARPTQSYGLYAQAFGRGLRPMPGKTAAIIIDHVGNVLRHGLPDAKRTWSLNRREQRSRTTPDDVIPLRVCLNVTCMAVYLRTQRNCPWCGHYSPPAGRSTIVQVDGDLLELDPATLAALRNEIDRIDGAARIPQNVSSIAQRGIANKHRKRQQSQLTLRATIALYAGHLKQQGHNDSEIYRIFYHTFKTDIATAQTLNVTPASALEEEISNAIKSFDTARNIPYAP